MYDTTRCETGVQLKQLQQQQQQKGGSRTDDCKMPCGVLVPYNIMPRDTRKLDAVYPWVTEVSYVNSVMLMVTS